MPERQGRKQSQRNMIKMTSMHIFIIFLLFMWLKMTNRYTRMKVFLPEIDFMSKFVIIKQREPTSMRWRNKD